MHFRPLLIIAAALAIAPPSRASVMLFSTGFEVSEGYATGQLSGQNGWFGSTITNVESAIFHSGARAASFTSQSGQFITSQSLSYNSVGNPNQIVELDLQFMMSNSGPVWEILAVSGNAGFIGQVLVGGGNATLGLASSTVGSVALTPNAWHAFRYVLDFQHQTQSAYVDSVLIGSGPFASASTQLTSMGFGQNSGSAANQTAYWDDLSVVSSAPVPPGVPLPPTVILTLTGVGLIGLDQARRKFARVRR